MHVHTSPIPHTEYGMISFFTLYFSLEGTWARYKPALNSAAREVLGPRLSAKKPYGFLRPLSVLSINGGQESHPKGGYRGVHALSWTTPEISQTRQKPMGGASSMCRREPSSLWRDQGCFCKLPTIEAEVCDFISSTKEEEEEDVLSKSF